MTGSPTYPPESAVSRRENVKNRKGDIKQESIRETGLGNEMKCKEYEPTEMKHGKA
jgi:hypothetical protein